MMGFLIYIMDINMVHDPTLRAIFVLLEHVHP